MTTSPGRSRGLRHRLRPADDSGSLAMALMLTLVGVTLSALLVPMVLTQLSTTRNGIRRADALNAAQAGIDVTLGRIRAAKDTNNKGLIQNLPCHVSAPAVGSGNTAAFDVEIFYLTSDPQGKLDDNTWLQANQIKCVKDSGTKSAPTYAVLKSTGTAGQTHRLLQSTYRLRVTKQPVRGGLIHLNGTSLCLDAGSATPAPGDNLRVQTCNPGLQQQQFAYGTNLNLYLAGTRIPGGDLGMCLDAGTPHVSGRPVRFQACATTTQPKQQWSFNDAANFEGTQDGTNLDGYCFAATSNTAGSPVNLLPCGAATSFSAEAAVGAGAAGASSNQLANFSQFGRCLDVPDFRVDLGFLIIWPCKQAPNPANVGWNQKWTAPTVAPGAKSATGPIYTDAPTGRYCLTSPRTTTAFQYVKVQLCPANLATAPHWIRYGDTGDPVTAYHIRDSAGFCLSPTDPSATPPDFFSKGYQISKVVVAECNRSALQRWNSPIDAGLEDLSER